MVASIPEAPHHEWHLVWSDFVQGVPVAQARPRVFRQGGKVITYEPEHVTAWKRVVAVQCARRQTHALKGPVKLALHFYLPRPQRLRPAKHPAWPIKHTSRPDLDNLVKAVVDGIQAAGWVTDDSQVQTLEATKHYAAADALPGVAVIIWTAEPSL